MIEGTQSPEKSLSFTAETYIKNSPWGCSWMANRGAVEGRCPLGGCPLPTRRIQGSLRQRVTKRRQRLKNTTAPTPNVASPARSNLRDRFGPNWDDSTTELVGGSVTSPIDPWKRAPTKPRPSTNGCGDCPKPMPRSAISFTRGASQKTKSRRSSVARKSMLSRLHREAVTGLDPSLSPRPVGSSPRVEAKRPIKTKLEVVRQPCRSPFELPSRPVGTSGRPVRRDQVGMGVSIEELTNRSHDVIAAARRSARDR